MGRRFGSIKLRPNKHTPRYLSASYPTPIEARELDPTLPERQSRNFPLTAEVEARAWLEAARKKIDAGACLCSIRDCGLGVVHKSWTALSLFLIMP